MKKKLLPAILILLAALLISAAASAAGRVLTASCPASGGYRIIWQKNKSGNFICLPGCWDASAVTLTMENENWDCIYLGEEKTRVALKEPVDLTPWLGLQVPAYSGEGSGIGTLRIMQGSPITDLMFEVDPKRFSSISSNKEKSITEGRLTALEKGGQVSFDGSLTLLQGRGNNSFRYPKKSYEFKIDSKAPLGGIDKAKTWIILANYADVTYLRNQIAMDLSGEVGLRYAVESAPADVWVNGEYLGLYLLTEKIQIKKYRVNITDLEDRMKEVNDQPLDSYPRFFVRDGTLAVRKGYETPNDPEDITGGYLVVIEKPYRMSKGNYPGVITEENLCFRIKEPTNPSRAEVDYIADLVRPMTRAVFSADGNDPVTGKHFSDFLDVNSFALKYLLDEYTKNYDVPAGSQYMFKDTDSVDPLFYAGPAWDYDLSFGNVTHSTQPPQKEFVPLREDKKYFYSQLGKHSEIKELRAKLWKENFRPALAVLMGDSPPRENGVLRSFAEYRDAITLSAEMNMLRRGRKTPVAEDAGEDFDSGIAYMERWIRLRAEYMDTIYTPTEQQE